jgi:hypothetical protein
MFAPGGKIDNVRARAAALVRAAREDDPYARFQASVRGDNLSFVLSSLSPFLWAGVLLHPVLGVLTFAVDQLDALLDGYFPTDLVRVRVACDPETLYVGHSGELRFYGLFRSQTTRGEANVEMAVRTAVAGLLGGASEAGGDLPASASEFLEQVVEGILRKLAEGMGVTAAELMLDLPSDYVVAEDVRLDMAYYALPYEELLDEMSRIMAIVWPQISIVDLLQFVRDVACPFPDEMGPPSVSFYSSLVSYDPSAGALVKKVVSGMREPHGSLQIFFRTWR